jgi:hypothetical protein
LEEGWRRASGTCADDGEVEEVIAARRARSPGEGDSQADAEAQDAMTKMVRKQVFITAEQDRKLKEQAAATGVSEAELIRAGIDLKLRVQAESSDWLSLVETFSDSWAERSHLEDEMREIRRSWNRREQVMERKNGRP